MNPLQAALLEHDFMVQYKKGTTMPLTTYQDYHLFRKNQTR
jgi:hypothetical protein